MLAAEPVESRRRGDPVDWDPCDVLPLVDDAGRVLAFRGAERALDCLDVGAGWEAFRVVALVRAPPLDVCLAERDPEGVAALALRGARAAGPRELALWAPFALPPFRWDRLGAGCRLVDLLDVVER